MNSTEAKKINFIEFVNGTLQKRNASIKRRQTEDAFLGAVH